MARLRDLPIVIRRQGLLKFAKNVWKEVSADNVFTYASALAYSWLFAIFPFFIFLLSLLPYLPERFKDGAQDRITSSITEYLGPKTAPTVLGGLKNVLEQPKQSLLSVGLLITIWAASGGMAMTMSALDAAYDADQLRPIWKQRPLAILLTVVVASLIITVIVLVPIGRVATEWVSQNSQAVLQKLGWSANLLSLVLIVASITRYIVAGYLLFLALAILHKFGTAAKTRFRLFSPGAVFSVVVWVALSFLFRLYVDQYASYEKTYGTVAGVAILLLFFYIDSLVLLMGAEINAEVNREININADASRDTDIPIGEID